MLKNDPGNKHKSKTADFNENETNISACLQFSTKNVCVVCMCVLCVYVHVCLYIVHMNIYWKWLVLTQCFSLLFFSLSLWLCILARIHNNPVQSNILGTHGILVTWSVM